MEESAERSEADNPYFKPKNISELYKPYGCIILEFVESVFVLNQNSKVKGAEFKLILQSPLPVLP
jgi:hypothetical protein